MGFRKMSRDRLVLGSHGEHADTGFRNFVIEFVLSDKLLRHESVADYDSRMDIRRWAIASCPMIVLPYHLG